MSAADARQRRAADPAASVWVAASAGSGKTKVLTDRVLRLLLAGSPPDRLLCLTYTRAAAAEMSARLAQRLATWATADDGALDGHLLQLLGRGAEAEERARARRLFFTALDAPGGLKIQTIHSFCQSLLARFPLEAGVAPDFRVLSERDAGELLGAALVATVAAAEQEGGALARALAAISWRLTEADLVAELRQLLREQTKLVDGLQAFGSVDAAEAWLRRRLGLAADDNEETIIDAAVAEGAFDAEGLRRAAEALAQQGGSSDRSRGEQVARWLAAPVADRRTAFDTYVNVFVDLGAKPLPEVRTRLATKAVADADPAALAALTAEAERLRTVVRRRLDARLLETSLALLRVATRVFLEQARLKEARGVIDFDDMIAITRRLLLADGACAWVHFKLDGGLDHVLIDEAQDTSREQWDIVRALTAEFFAGEGAREVGRTVFAVGDIKQSIFSFQGAAPQEFLTNRAVFAEACRGALRPWHEVDLPTSFRSTAAVLAAVDAVFATSPARDGVALDDAAIRHEVSRVGCGGSVELWPPLVVPKTANGADDFLPVRAVREEPPQRQLARLVAERIQAMIEGGERLPARGRPIGPGDIMVLVRRRTAFVEALVRDLRDRGVPVAGVDRMRLTEQLAIMDLLAIGRFALLPEDDLTLAVVLKGPLIGLDEETLFRLAWSRQGSLWQALGRAAGEGGPDLAAALERLNAVRARADVVTPFAFFSAVLVALGGRSRILARLGPDAEEPIAEFLQLALDFEQLHPPTLEGFLAWVEAGRDVEIKRDLEQAPAAVRILTVHGAKGLQAPIVILPDTLQLPKKTPRLAWLEEAGAPPLPLWAPRRDDEGAAFVEARAPLLRARDEEHRRLLYVAMTRAEDRLIVCGWRDRNRNEDPAECWYKLIEAGLRRAGGGGLTLEEVADEGLQRAGVFGEAPRVLILNCPQTAPVAAEAAPAVPAPSPLPPWAWQAPTLPPAPLRPLAPSRPEGEPPVASPLGAGGGSGLLRGRLIHRLLQFLPELPPPARPAAGARWLARPVHGLSPAEQDELLAETLAVLEAPQAAPLFGPESLAEVPLAGRLGDRLLAGQVDRLVITKERVILLDYKTDRPPPATEAEVPEVYVRQMAAYRRALSAIYPGRAIDCLLLWTCGPRLMALDPARLDRAAAEYLSA